MDEIYFSEDDTNEIYYSDCELNETCYSEDNMDVIYDSDYELQTCQIEPTCPYFAYLVHKIKIKPLQYLRRVMQV
jgi:hypothetical protein